MTLKVDILRKLQDSLNRGAEAKFQKDIFSNKFKLWLSKAR